MNMRVLFIGDIVGRPGVVCVKELTPAFRTAEKLDLIVANAENASGGSGMLPSAYRQLRAAGVDVVTMGDHIYKKQDLIPVLAEDERICKPANFPPDAPGFEYAHAVAADGSALAVISLLGRTYMRPVDCPFRAVDRVLEKLAGRFPVVIVDMHAETTADKYLMLHHLKGRVAAVIGTHTHVQTADEQILEGTAFVCDVGMTGPYDSVLGRRVDRVLSTTLTFVPSAFDVAEGDVRLGGAVIDIDPATGKAGQIRRILLKHAGCAGRAEN